MASMREIRMRMKSIQDTMKITNAMYLISSSKLKKARKSLEATEPYFETLQKTIHDILVHAPEIEHEYFDQHDEIPSEKKKRGYIIITADKGLAGAYNHNVIKMAEEQLEKGSSNTMFMIGQVGRHYFEKKNVIIDCEFLYAAQDPAMFRVRDITETIVDLYKERELDEVYVIYTKMITPMKAEPEMIQLLPLQKGDFLDVHGYKYQQSAKFEPSPQKVMNHMVPNYIQGLLYGTLVESFSSEQNSRMMAMDSATKSAKEMLADLSLLYNRARQSAITQEITEVVSGAKRLKK